LRAFVGQVVRPLPHVRQRENALLYVRGLIEQGGRKSLQPTLFRLQESPARYESMQQFLADSPWDPAVLVRACAERVTPDSPKPSSTASPTAPTSSTPAPNPGASNTASPTANDGADRSADCTRTDYPI
jgi:hypothetical protein